MQAERWKEIQELYEAAIALPPEKRAGFLAQACPADAALRGEVQSLLEQKADSFLESALVSAIKTLNPGARLGNFEIVELIGRGGMGEVYRARDSRLKRFTATGMVGPIRLVSRARDIKLEQFTQSVELDTERGDIEITPGKLPLAAIEARSGSGKIELLLPEKAAFHLEATAERGDAVNDFGAPIEKHTEGRSATLKGRVGDGPNI